MIRYYQGEFYVPGVADYYVKIQPTIPYVTDDKYKISLMIWHQRPRGDSELVYRNDLHYVPRQLLQKNGDARMAR